MTPSDSERVARALRGEQDAFRQLVDQHGTAVFNLIVRMVRDRGIAEELAQDTFVKAFGALRTFDPAFKFKSWLLRIAHNTAIDYLRKMRPATVSMDAGAEGAGVRDALVDQGVRSPFDRAVDADLARALEWALARIRPEYRRLVVLRYQEDLSYEEIAQTVDVPLGTVKSHLHRARQELAQILADAGWGQESGPES